MILGVPNHLDGLIRKRNKSIFSPIDFLLRIMANKAIRSQEVEAMSHKRKVLLIVAPLVPMSEVS